MSEKIWLRWDGIYDTTGICNKPLESLADDSATLIDVKERLKLLGFDCGALDDTFNNETKKALLEFNGFCNHPNINRLQDPNSLDWHAYFDDDSKSKLAELEEDWFIEPVVDPPPNRGRMRVMLSRSHFARNQTVDYTMNSSINLAVKVVSTPKAISRYFESAAIKLEIEGFDHVKSLMFRVYRNTDPSDQELAVPEEKLVYQEVLTENEIRCLPRNGPGSGKAEHNPSKAYIMSQVIPDRPFAPMFGESLGKIYDRLHAPYLVRVWISTREDEFDVFTDKEVERAQRDDEAIEGVMPEGIFDEDDPLAADADALEFSYRNIFYLDSKSLEKMRTLRREAIKEENRLNSVVSTNEPEVDHKKTVHDRSNIDGKKRKRELINSWNELKSQNGALNKKKRWTGTGKIGVDYIEKECRDHDHRYLENNIIQPERFPDNFALDPVGVYRKLRTHLDAKDHNFTFPELSEFFENVKRHINLIRRRLCCGQWSHVDSTTKKAIIKSFKDSVIPGITELEGRSFPYRESMNFVNRFANLFAFIVHVAVAEPELEFYRKFGIGELGAVTTSEQADAYYVRDRRNRIDGYRSPDGSEYGYNTGEGKDHGLHLADPARFFETTKKGFESMHVATEKISGEFPDTIARPIAFPSYNVLDPFYFIKTRAVPMFIIGLIDLRYLPADGIRQTPITFFEHDLFHVGRITYYKSESEGAIRWPGNLGGGQLEPSWFRKFGQDIMQLWPTLYIRLNRVLENNLNDLNSEWDVYDFWQENIDILKRRIESAAGAQKDTLSLLLFWILHEPKSDAGFPRVPEKSEIVGRLEDYGIIDIIRHQDSVDFFGDYTHPFMPHLDWAALQVRALAVGLKDVNQLDDSLRQVNADVEDGINELDDAINNL